MSGTNRRELVRSLGALAPAGLLLGTAAEPARAQAQTEGSKGAIDEQRAQEIIASVKPAVVLLEVEGVRGMSWGSGFFVSSDGLVITNEHVVRDAQKITCVVRNQQKLTAKVIKIDPQYDLALVKVDVPQPVSTVTLGDSSAVREGHLVGVTGYPQPGRMVWIGMSLDSSTSRGAVNGLRFGSGGNTFLGENAIQIDAPVAPGNSGGPVFRLDTGEVVGVLTNGFSGDDNLTFAVPANQAKVLVLGTGMKVTAKPMDGRSKDAVVEPGDLKALNSIGVNKELPYLFGHSHGAQVRTNLTSKQRKASDEWEQCTGNQPPAITPLSLQEDVLLFGTIDGKLIRWNAADPRDEFTTLLHVDEFIFVYPPAVNEEIIVASAGALDLDQRLKEKFNPLGLLAIGLFGFGNLTRKRNVVELEGVGSLFGINRKNGNIDWEHPAGFVGTPIVSKGRVYFGGMGERGCVDAADGKERWSHEKKDGANAEWFHVGYAGDLGVLSVVVPVEGKRKGEGPLTLVSDGKARVECFDPETGKPRWKVEIGDIKSSKQPLNTAFHFDEQKKVVYALADQVVAAVDVSDPQKGKLIWAYDRVKRMEAMKGDDKVKAKNLPGFTANLVINEGIVYVGSDDRKLHALDGAKGTFLWSYSARGAVGQPTYHEGVVLVGSTDGFVHAVDAKTGQLKWRASVRSAVRSQPAIRAGMVYAPTEDGRIYTVRMPIV